jgi:hypothetical protein
LTFQGVHSAKTEREALSSGGRDIQGVVVAAIVSTRRSPLEKAAEIAFVIVVGTDKPPERLTATGIEAGKVIDCMGSASGTIGRVIGALLKQFGVGHRDDAACKPFGGGSVGHARLLAADLAAIRA